MQQYLTWQTGDTPVSSLLRQCGHFSISGAEDETIRWFLSQPGVFINEKTPDIMESQVGRNLLGLLTATKQRNLEKLRSILNSAKYVFVDVCDEVS
jgi:hypothetical protein